MVTPGAHWTGDQEIIGKSLVMMDGGRSRQLEIELFPESDPESEAMVEALRSRRPRMVHTAAVLAESADGTDTEPALTAPECSLLARRTVDDRSLGGVPDPLGDLLLGLYTAHTLNGADIWVLGRTVAAVEALTGRSAPLPAEGAGTGSADAASYGARGAVEAYGARGLEGLAEHLGAWLVAEIATGSREEDQDAEYAW